MNPAMFQPVGQCMQIASERGETADGLWVSISADGDEQLTGAYIDSRSIRMQDRKCVASPFAWPFAPPILPVGCPGRGHRANSQSRSSSETDRRHHMSVRNPRTTLHGRVSKLAPMPARGITVIQTAPPSSLDSRSFTSCLTKGSQFHACADLSAIIESIRDISEQISDGS
jgi:hypothetical protein